MEALPEIYPLTGLQIGDIQSYISRPFVYFAPLSKRILVMVDNRPWLVNKQPRSSKLWQLMITKYRMSPFINSKALQNVSETAGDAEEEASGTLTGRRRRRLRLWWLASIDLNRALHGFLVFDIVWKDVHGINYVNELQADTSLAIEVRYMKKWEFYGPEQAAASISQWFLGRIPEAQALKCYLKKLSDTDANEAVNLDSLNMAMKKSRMALEAVSEDEFLDVHEDLPSSTTLATPAAAAVPLPPEKLVSDSTFIAPTQYVDTLLLFQFSHSLVPFKLRQIIMSDIRLLTLLESGLPAWVIFFQSYPPFSHCYRPWMRPLAGALYLLISLITLIIGFYDLYKNVPLLKAAVARISGPLFDWIETWDMMMRIQYLGTILFLRNLRRTINWILSVVRIIRAVLVAVVEPLATPLCELAEILTPLCTAVAEAAELFSSSVMSALTAVSELVVDLAELLWAPVALLEPVIGYLFNICLLPVQCAVKLAGVGGALLSNTYNLMKDIWETMSSIFEFSSLSEAQHSSFDVSVYKSLWNDLFSHVFRAARSVFYSLLAFFASFNRHRRSIYNRVVGRLGRTQPLSSHCKRRSHPGLHHGSQEEECDYCK